MRVQSVNNNQGSPSFGTLKIGNIKTFQNRAAHVYKAIVENPAIQKFAKESDDVLVFSAKRLDDDLLGLAMKVRKKGLLGMLRSRGTEESLGYINLDSVTAIRQLTTETLENFIAKANKHKQWLKLAKAEKKAEVVAKKAAAAAEKAEKKAEVAAVKAQKKARLAAAKAKDEAKLKEMKDTVAQLNKK